METAEITGYHAHVYFTNPEARSRAAVIRENVSEKFNVRMGRWREKPVGPHPQPMFQIAFEPPLFSEIVPWLMLNRDGLVILVHPETGDNYVDHIHNALWLGAAVPLDEDFLRSGQTSA